MGTRRQALELHKVGELNLRPLTQNQATCLCHIVIERTGSGNLPEAKNTKKTLSGKKKKR